MKKLGKIDTRIPRRALLWLAVALTFTLPPMIGSLALWVPIAFLAALAAKFWMEPRGYRLRSTLMKLLIAASVLFAIFATYGSVSGIEPGISLVALLMSIKILEEHTAREFQITVMVAFVLCLCGLFLSQSLGVAIFLVIAFVLLLTALIQFHRGATSSLWSPFRAAVKLFLQALPLMVLLFLLFPRVSTGFRFQIVQSHDATTGFSGQLSAGSVSSLAHSSAVAFRAEFPDGDTPVPASLYWRGVTMSQGNGFEWRASETPAAMPRANQKSTGSTAIRQWITLEPHDGHWMFALDWPVTSPTGSFLTPANYLWSGQPIRKSRRYEVVSVPHIREKELYPRERDLFLRAPDTISPKARSLAESWKTGGANPRAITSNALEFFRTQGFTYSLSPGDYKKNDLDEFLFQRRLGFCEHYAAAFATLMRLAGVPARVVTGFLGGEYNEIGKFYLVRQSDAHAWCEVWLPESGWIRIDPTAVVAPDRVNIGLTYFLERRGAEAQSQVRHRDWLQNLWRSPIFNRARLAWQTLGYEWDTHVLSFDAEAQESFFAAFGITSRSPIFLLTALVFLSSCLLGIYALVSRLRARPTRDRVKNLYENFCAKAAKLGVARNLTEGPLDFSNRARQLLPRESEHIRRITDAYVALRYHTRADRELVNSLAVAVTSFGRDV